MHSWNWHSFISLLRFDGALSRNFASKVNAISAAFDLLKNLDFNFVGILDADITFDKNYYENIIRKFILKFMSDNSLPSDRTIYNSNQTRQVKSRIDKESEKTYLPHRGGHDIYYLDLKDLNLYFNKHQSEFSTIFPTIPWITEKVDELYDIRNLIAHNSFNIDKNTLDLVRVVCRQIIILVDKIF